eukprot:gene11513-12705_t
MPRADRCKRKKEEELKKAASKVKKITSLFAFQKNTSNCSEESAVEKSIQEPVTNHFELQEIDSRNRGPSKESSSVFGVKGHRDCNEDLSHESGELGKGDFNNTPRRSNITPFTFAEPLSIKTNIVTDEGWSSNASVCNEESADFLISAHSEVTPTEDAVQEGPILPVCTARCCSNDAPFIPTEDDLKKTSQKQTMSSGKDKGIKYGTSNVQLQQDGEGIFSLQYLTRQGLAIRWDHEGESNLYQLLKTRSEDVPNLNRWIDKSHYTSPDIVNELIEMMGNDVLRSILEDIRSNFGLFSLIADESRDISNKEQLTFYDGSRFLSLAHMKTL